MSLDIVCKDKTEFTTWIEALKYLTKYGPPSDKSRTKVAVDKKAGRKSVTMKKIGSPTAGSVKPPTAGKPVDAAQMIKEKMEESNDAYAWGMAGWGQLGLGDEENRSLPTLMEAMLGKGVRTISCGYSHTAILTETNDCFTWGAGGCGRLGHVSTCGCSQNIV